MTATDKEDNTPGGKVYHLSGDFRGAIVNVESTFVNSAAAVDIEGLPPEPGDPPYKGLQYFDEADADNFLGREALTARLVGRLAQTRFLAVIGASGSGKSSVVRAGVLPALRRGKQLDDGALPPAGSDKWLSRVMTPTAHPLDALAATLLPEAEPAAVAALRDELAAGHQTLSRSAARALEGTEHPRLLLVVDQFEELFSLGRHEGERLAFINNLVSAATGDAPIHVIIVLRADFYARCAQYDGLRELVSHQQEYIGAMNREELFRVIVLPAARDDWKIQEGLVELMLDDVGDEPGALPLLSHALLETCKRRRGRTMTLSGYKESGGVRGAIAKTAETVLQQKLTPDQRPIARMIFVRLTELGESADGETPDTRRRASFSELITRATDEPMLEAVLNILVDSRLVSTDLIPPGETKVVEVSHEALIREWPTLRQWLNQDRDGLIRHRQLTGDVNDWLGLDRDPGALYRGAKLEQTLVWAADPPDPLSADEQAFLDASRALAARSRRDVLVQRALIGVSAVLLLAIVGIVLYQSGLFAPAAKMGGTFNIAVAEFAVLDEDGRLTNRDHDGGLRIAERIGNGLRGVFADEPDVWVWFDGPELEEAFGAEIGVAGVEPVDATDPAEMSEELNADMVIFGTTAPAGNLSDLTLRFYLRPQFGADFSQMVGTHEFTTRIPVFDPQDPREEVWRELDPLANALALMVMGMRQEILGQQDEALASFERAAEFAPDSDILHYFIGQEHLYIAQGGGDETALDAAEASFNRSLELNPGNPRAMIGLGSVHFNRAQEQLDVAEENADPAAQAAALELARQEAQQALDLYTEVAARPDQSEIYGVPVAGIARLGRAISFRVLGESSYWEGDLTAAEADFDRGIATLESDIEALDIANDPRLAAQTYQALGSIYEWKAFLLDERGETGEAQAAQDKALAYYLDCRQQGEDYRTDTYLSEHIVGELCEPRIDALQSLTGGE